MDVDPQTAYRYLALFARFEFTLKRLPHFLSGEAGEAAMVHWPNVKKALTALSEADFVERVPQQVRDKVLGGRRDRPRVQKVVMRAGKRIAKFQRQQILGSDAVVLLMAAKRVRNNLFHGGKEEPNGGNQEWVLAAERIVEQLLQLDWHRMAP